MYIKYAWNYLNYSQQQREVSSSQLRTVNHRSAPTSHIPDVQFRVEGFAAVYLRPETSQRGAAENVPSTLHQLTHWAPFSFLLFYPDINLTQPAEKHEIQSGGWPNPEKVRAPPPPLTHFLQGERLGRLSGEKKKKQNGLKEHSKTFNRRRATGPGFQSHRR